MNVFKSKPVEPETVSAWLAKYPVELDAEAGQYIVFKAHRAEVMSAEEFESEFALVTIEAPKAEKPAKKKRKMTDEGRVKIAAAAKRRWAAQRGETPAPTDADPEYAAAV
jgi:hypothetical protein